MRDNQYEMALLQAGVRVVMPENLEPSLQLASQALQAVGTPDDEIYQIIECFRRSYKQNALLNAEETAAKDASPKPKMKEAKT
jgi:CPA2 family monovalent cation:H+ antiporter-2